MNLICRNNWSFWKKELIIVFLLITFSFPKAGAIILGAPVTLSTILYGVLLLVFIPCFFNYGKNCIFVTCYYVTYSILVCLNTVLQIGNLPLKNYLFPLVVAFSPLAYLVGKNIKYECCVKILSVSGIIVGLYSVLQWLFGITQTTIPGITLALGDSWENKPIGYGFTTLHEATKMPSTAQNGNNIAILCVLAIGILLTWLPGCKRWFYTKWISLGLFFTALVLSGARSSVYPFVCLLPFGIYGVWKQYRSGGKREWLTLLFTIVFSVLFVLLLLQIPQLTPLANQKTAVDYVEEPSRLIADIGTASGRTDIWYNMLQTIETQYSPGNWLRLILIGAPGEEMMMGGEGLPLFISMFGMVSAGLFMGLFIPIFKLLKNFPTFVWGAFSFAGALAVDSGYNYPPILIWFFLLLGVMITHNQVRNVR